jgi:hypothetical protein
MAELRRDQIRQEGIIESCQDFIKRFEKEKTELIQQS